MCELLAMSSQKSTRLTYSLASLASHAKGVSRDGWGVAYYQGLDVALYRDITSAEDSSTVKMLESSGPMTTLSIAYIRHATYGTIKLANTGPYTRELNGRMHVFSHNGNLTNLPPCSGRARFQPIGETDSEQAFCLLLERMSQLNSPSNQLPSAEARIELVTATAKELRSYGPASFLYSDGDLLFAHADRRIQPLTKKVSAPALYLLECPLVDSEINQGVILLASVPLSKEDWKPLPEGQVISARNGKIVSTIQL